MIVLKQGDFVFAKVKGFRPWPARILEPGARHYHVFFYGTRQTAKVRPDDLYPYFANRLRLGYSTNLKSNLKSNRQRKFQEAMLQADLMFESPHEDYDFYQILAMLRDSYEETMSQDGEDDDYQDDYLD